MTEVTRDWRMAHEGRRCVHNRRLQIKNRIARKIQGTRSRIKIADGKSGSAMSAQLCIRRALNCFHFI